MRIMQRKHTADTFVLIKDCYRDFRRLNYVLALKPSKRWYEQTSVDLSKGKTT